MTTSPPPHICDCSPPLTPEVLGPGGTWAKSRCDSGGVARRLALESAATCAPTAVKVRGNCAPCRIPQYYRPFPCVRGGLHQVLRQGVRGASKTSGRKVEEFGQEAGCGSQSISHIWVLG